MITKKIDEFQRYIITQIFHEMNYVPSLIVHVLKDKEEALDRVLRKLSKSQQVTAKI